ncbi:MFS transporter [Salinispora vitiensis]|uniref:MFS transporter n=1 Tax=Salinispora vitiensis TaxID=999544 RepID=UPI0003609150|nr:MFS transporter [Salinispora vitiensis]
MQLLEPLRHKEFRAAWLGQTINIFGDAVFGVAIALFLLPRPDAARAISLVLAMVALGGVVSVLVGGVLADRRRRTVMIIISDLIRLVALAAILLAGPAAPLPTLLTAALVMGLGLGLYRPAYGALLPSLLPPALIAPGNALRAMSNRIAAVAGAAAAGVMVAATSAQTTLLIDMATFLISISTLLVIRDVAPQLGQPQTSVWQDFREGLHHVRARPWMSSIMVQGTVQLALVNGPLYVLLPLVLGTESERIYGLVVAAEATGSLAGAAFAGTRHPRRPGYAAMFCLLAQLPQLASLALGATGLLLAPLSFVAGAGLGGFAVLWLSALQASTPKEKLGRVMSVDSLANTAFTPIGLALAGWLFTIAGPTTLATIAAGVLVLSVVIVLPIPGIANLGSPATPRPRDGATVNTPVAS